MLFTENLPIKNSPNGILLYTKVTPNASKNRMGKILDGHLKIYVVALPENGQANKLVIELLSEWLKISKTNISIVQGLTSPLKVINIAGDRDFIVQNLKIVL